jgi:hypothetical protein
MAEVEFTPGGLTGIDDRHPSVRHFAALFAYGHLPAHLAAVSLPLAMAAAEACNAVGDGPELAAGLRKLLEAKDCLVRQAVIDAQKVA